MSGGIEWFRWHHGSVNDQKFGLVAKKAGASVAEVIATWACLLEQASAADDRGNPGIPDFEAIDFALGMGDGTARRIYERMRERMLIDPETGRIASWEKRQPKRERTDDGSSDRVRAFRERQRQQDNSNTTERQETPKANEETPCNAMERQETPREEESREERKTTSSARADSPPGFERFWLAWPKSPRKVAKAECVKRWRSRGLEAEADAIVAAVEALKGSRQWRDGFEPAPLTFLNQRRWLDGDDGASKAGCGDWWLSAGFGDEATARAAGLRPEVAA